MMGTIGRFGIFALAAGLLMGGAVADVLASEELVQSSEDELAGSESLAPSDDGDGNAEIALTEATETTSEVPQIQAASEVTTAELGTELEQREITSDPLFMNYYAIFYGPALKGTSAYQPTPSGEQDLNRPILLKNFMTLGYNLSEQLILAGTAYWTWNPVFGQKMAMQDPYVRLGYDGLIRTDHLNLYADMRVHFPISSVSRQNDMLAAFQSYQALSYTVGDGPLTLLLFGSERANVFGKRGYGNDLELYLGPSINVRLSRKLALTVLYEMQVNHEFGQKAFSFYSEPSDLEPGVSWEISPNLSINPYLNLYPGSKMTLSSSSIGMLMSSTLL